MNEKECRNASGLMGATARQKVVESKRKNLKYIFRKPFPRHWRNHDWLDEFARYSKTPILKYSESLVEIQHGRNFDVIIRIKESSRVAFLQPIPTLNCLVSSATSGLRRPSSTFHCCSHPIFCRHPSSESCLASNDLLLQMLIPTQRPSCMSNPRLVTLLSQSTVILRVLPSPSMGLTSSLISKRGLKFSPSNWGTVIYLSGSLLPER